MRHRSRQASWHCPTCGYRIWSGECPDHVCDERSVIRRDVEQFEQMFRIWLAETNEGRFAQHLARIAG